GSGAQALSHEDVRDAEVSLKNNAGLKSRSWSLGAALIDPQLKVYRCTDPTRGVVEYFSDDELDDQADPKAWIKGEAVTGPAGSLLVNGRDAQRLGLARHVVQNFDEFKQRNGLDEMALVEPGWAHFLIGALAAPGVALLLLFIGGAALYAELHAPGIGVGGFI